jgi:uncharacterized protein YciI
MFIVILTYLKPLETVDEHLEDHRSYLKRLYAAKHLVCSGPLNPRTGGVLLVRDMSREALDALIDEDPFHRAGVARYEILSFRPTGYDPSFANFVGR